MAKDRILLGVVAAPHGVRGLVRIRSFTADPMTPVAGAPIAFTVMLDKAAPEGGQKLTFDVGDMDAPDPGVTVPEQVIVPAGQTSSPVPIMGHALRPTSRLTITVHSGENTQRLVLRVTGLEIAEVMADPSGADDGLQWIKIRNTSNVAFNLNNYQLRAGENNYNLVVADLNSYTIPAGGCAVIGGPTQSSTNGAPNFTQLLNFTPDLPNTGTQAAGFALFEQNATPVDGILAPVDTMLVGAINNSRLIGPDAEIASPYCSAPIPGKSVRRTSSSTCEQAQMQPNSCN